MSADEQQPLLSKRNDCERRSSSNEGSTASTALVTSIEQPTGGKFHQFSTALIATIGAFAVGNVVGWSGPARPRITTDREYGFAISDEENMWIESLIALGAASMCFPAGCLMDRIGRTSAIRVLIFPFILGWTLVLLAVNVDMLYVGRFILGLAVGGSCVVIPAYVSEIAQDCIRGTLGTFFQLMVTIGVLFSFVVGGYYNIYFFNLCCLLVPFLFGIIFCFVPETPYYHVKCDRIVEAKKTLIWLRGNQYNLEAEIESLTHKVRMARLNRFGIRRSMDKVSAKKAVGLCLSLLAIQQVSGVNAILFNTTTIFHKAGVKISPKLSTIIVGLIQVLATFLSSLLIDKVGRRILLLFSCGTIVISETALGIYFYLIQTKSSDHVLIDALSWLPLTALCTFIVAFSIGLGPIPWLLSGELCTNDVKAYANSIAGTSNWWIAFVITATFDQMQIEMGVHGAFWLFAGCSFIGFVFIKYYLPETKGKNIDEIQIMLETH